MNSQAKWESSKTTQLGMSLIELIAVIAVIGVLATLVFSVYDGARDRSRNSGTQAQLASIRVALDRYREVFGDYPAVTSGDAESRSQTLLTVLKEGTRSSTNDRVFVEERHLFIESGVIVDAWDQPIFYSYDPTWSHGQYFLMSTGKDGIAEFPNGSGQYDPEQSSNLDNLEGIE